ncbi:MAG: extracellular solute-binding protein [Isosphaeraceae bacterium]
MIRKTRLRSKFFSARSLALLVLGGIAASGAFGCGAGTGVGNESPLIAYVALDREFSEPILKSYEKKTGRRVDAIYDVESTKSVGLAQRIIAERTSPRCDVYWNNEILNTIRLQRRGLLEPIKTARGDEIPATFKAKDGTWYGFAARARVILVNTELVADKDRPKGIRDMLDPKWKDKIGLAKPLFGTTATHAACLFAAWGEDKAKAYYEKMKANGVKIFSGNKGVAQAVGSGRIAFGMTDTDDALGEIDAGNPVAIVYPDREPDQLGTLFIPNVVSVIKGCPHPAAALELVDDLLKPDVEIALAKGASAQIPLNPNVNVKLRVETPKTVHPMNIDFAAAADLWDIAADFLTREFADN